MKIPGITSERMSAIFSKKTHLIFSQEAFTMRAIPNSKSKENCVGIITGKKAISKQAVIRNRVDRRIKAAIQTVYPNLKATGYDFLIFSRPPIVTLPWETLTEQVRKSFGQFEKKVTTGAKKSKERSF